MIGMRRHVIDENEMEEIKKALALSETEAQAARKMNLSPANFNRRLKTNGWRVRSILVLERLDAKRFDDA